MPANHSENVISYFVPAEEQQWLYRVHLAIATCTHLHTVGQIMGVKQPSTQTNASLSPAELHELVPIRYSIYL